MLLCVLQRHKRLTEVLLAGKNLEYYHSFHENIRVKSGAWDEHGVFIYSTLSHVKYCLPNGDSGIIHSLASPIYIVRVHKPLEML